VGILFLPVIIAVIPPQPPGVAGGHHDFPVGAVAGIPVALVVGVCWMPEAADIAA